MSYLLAFDCSTNQASVAILKTEPFELLFESQWEARASSHSDRLVLEISKLIKKTNIEVKKLSALAVGLGPGRFTGVRTAICTAKSLAYSLKIPVYTLNSLKAIAKSHSTEEPVCVAIQAFKNQVYYGEFNSDTQSQSVLDFKQWQKKMHEMENSITCISDLEDFYKIDPIINQKHVFKRPKISAFKLAEISLKENKNPLNWSELKADYQRSNM